MDKEKQVLNNIEAEKLKIEFEKLELEEGKNETLIYHGNYKYYYYIITFAFFQSIL
jgi:hypothetical protein